MPSAYANFGELRSGYDARDKDTSFEILWLEINARTTPESDFARMSMLSGNPEKKEIWNVPRTAKKFEERNNP